MADVPCRRCPVTKVYCCYGMYADVGHDSDCENAKRTPGVRGVPRRLSSAEAREDVERLWQELASDPAKARALLIRCGILTPDGKRSPDFYPDDPDGVQEVPRAVDLGTPIPAGCRKQSECANPDACEQEGVCVRTAGVQEVPYFWCHGASHQRARCTQQCGMCLAETADDDGAQEVPRANFKCVACGWIGRVDQQQPQCPNCALDRMANNARELGLDYGVQEVPRGD